MGFFDYFRRKITPVSGGYGGYYANPVGGDIFRKSAPPTPMELIMQNMGVANACARLNSQGVAKVQLRLFVSTKKGQKKPKMAIRGDTRKIDTKTFAHLSKSPQTGQRMRNSDEVEEVTDHPLLDLLRMPGGKDENSLGMGQFGLFEITQGYLEVVGMSFWYVERSGLGGTPSALWPLPAQFVQQIPGDGNSGLVKEYILAVGGEKTHYSPDEIIPFRMTDLYNPYLGGFSPLRAGIESQKVMRQAVALTNARMQNGGRPSAVWSPDPGDATGGMIDEANSARLRNAFRAAWSQAGAGGVAISPIAGSIEALSWPMNDIIDSARYEMTERQICAAFGVPSTKVNRKDSNRASAESGDYAHAEDAISPRCASNADVINRFLVPMFDNTGRLFVAYDSPVKDDAAYQLEQTKLGANQGVLEIDEIRASLGQDPLPGTAGSVRLVPQGYIPVNPDGTIDKAFADAIAAMKPQQPESQQKPDAKKDGKIRKRLLSVGYGADEVESLMEGRL